MSHHRKIVEPNIMFLVSGQWWKPKRSCWWIFPDSYWSCLEIGILKQADGLMKERKSKWEGNLPNFTLRMHSNFSIKFCPVEFSNLFSLYFFMMFKYLIFVNNKINRLQNGEPSARRVDERNCQWGLYTCASLFHMGEFRWRLPRNNVGNKEKRCC